MNLAIFTLYEGDYHVGVAALVNSAFNCGFKGKIFILYKDKLPPWSLSNQWRDSFGKTGINVCFEKCITPRHFGYHKPFAARAIFDANPDLDGLIYADPDIVFLAPYKFFEQWIDGGVALCLDSNFRWLHKNHPWRRDWRALAKRAGLPIQWDSPEYSNSGFFGLKKEAAQFLYHWMTVILQFEKEGGDTSGFDMQNRYRSIVSDQDALAASLYAILDEPAYLGQEGMGFNGHYFILSHAIENPKPWRQFFTKLALKGRKPSISAKLWLKHAQFPIPAMSRTKYLLTKIDLNLASFISRFWGI